MDLDFPNPIGLAAGFDRDGRLLKWLAPTGFGFVEIGTFNYPHGKTDGGGLETVAANLKRTMSRRNERAPRQLVGLSLGSTNETFNEQTVQDYCRAMELFRNYADYLVINLSRPGFLARAPDLDSSALAKLMKSARQSRDELASRRGIRVPVVIKVAVDEECNEIPQAIRLAKEAELDGVIAAFERWQSRDRLLGWIERLDRCLHPMPLIAVGGIRTAQDAGDYLEAGAKLVQFYTALVEQGPFLARRIVAQASCHPKSFGRGSSFFRLSCRDSAQDSKVRTGHQL